MRTVTAVTTIHAPAPLGHYVQASKCDGLVYVSGQLALRPDGSHTAAATFEEQARQALDNLLSIVSAAGSSPAGVLKVTAYIVGVENWPVFNRIYGEKFGAAKPARSVVPVPDLHHGYLIELDAVAVCDDEQETVRNDQESQA